jgi:hypothetical protein
MGARSGIGHFRRNAAPGGIGARLFDAAGSFGFWLMIQTADRVYLRTGEGGTGTTLVLEQDTRRPAPPDDNADRSLPPRQNA